VASSGEAILAAGPAASSLPDRNESAPPGFHEQKSSISEAKAMSTALVAFTLVTLAADVTTGPLAVESVENITLHDAKRRKELPVAVCYPKEAGRYPVIVFSHGAGGSGPRVLALPKFWASHGYVVLVPTHADSLSLQRRQPAADAKDRLQGIVRRAVTDSALWLERAGDVSFLLDSFADLEAKALGLNGKLDPARVGVGGHSLGAFTAQVIGGATIDVGGEKGKSLADPRVKAVVMLSGQGAGQMGLTDKSWEKLTLPMLTATGSKDRGAGGQGPEWRKEPFEKSPAGDKYHLFIEGASHFSFTGPAGGAIFGAVEQATLHFWDAYLKGDAQAKAWLHSAKLESATLSWR
jgi:predicted dienelactone hydrolase